MKLLPLVALVAVIVAEVIVAPFAAARRPEPRGQLDPIVADRVVRLTRASVWRQVQAIPVRFRTWHPQGMVKVGDTFIVSSVEVTRTPERFAQPAADGLDRSAGAGVGHLFKIDRQGNLLADVRVGEGDIYHPGGLDFDGRSVWMPVAEYRPDSRAILYRVDPATMRTTEMRRVADHIGGLVADPERASLHGISWGSRRLYRWPMPADDRTREGVSPTAPSRQDNPAHYVDAQDCKFAGRGRMLCTGVSDFRVSTTTPVFRLGGLDLINLTDGRPVHQVPLALWTPSGRPMAQNPSWFEPTPTGLRAYFMPDDDESVIYVYEVETASLADPPRQG